LAALYVEEIRAIQSDGPYLLGGACFGAWPAFEIAQQLRAQSQEVALLAILDCAGPDPLYRRLRRPIYRLGYHWEKLTHLRHTERLPYLLQLGRRVLSKAKSTTLEDDKDVENDYRKQIFAAFWSATKAYTPNPYAGRVALFFSREGSSRSFFFPKGGWHGILTGELEVHVVPGDHITFLESPNVLVLAEKMRDCLHSVCY